MQGDSESWRKVLLQQGYGDMANLDLEGASISSDCSDSVPPVIDKREMRRESMQLSMQLIAHQYVLMSCQVTSSWCIHMMYVCIYDWHFIYYSTTH